MIFLVYIYKNKYYWLHLLLFSKLLKYLVVIVSNPILCIYKYVHNHYLIQFLQYSTVNPILAVNQSTYIIRLGNPIIYNWWQNIIITAKYLCIILSYRVTSTYTQYTKVQAILVLFSKCHLVDWNLPNTIMCTISEMLDNWCDISDYLQMEFVDCMPWILVAKLITDNTPGFTETFKVSNYTGINRG
jgi:hypothetical protein